MSPEEWAIKTGAARLRGADVPWWMLAAAVPAMGVLSVGFARKR